MSHVNHESSSSKARRVTNLGPDPGLNPGMSLSNDVEAAPSPKASRSLISKMRGRRTETKQKLVVLGIAIILGVVFVLGQWRQSGAQKWALASSHNASAEIQALAKTALGGTSASGATTINQVKTTGSGPILGKGERSLSRQSIEDLRNATLGFGNVYVINMKSRMDKLDAMKLAASLTDFRFDVIPAVDGSQVSAKVLTTDFPESDNHDGQIGCWRSHLSFAHRIIENNLASAMIIEDDADWDVNFRSQLEHIALGSQTLLDTPKKGAPFSPYGDGWDLIWLGHCASQPINDDFRRYLMKNDPTVTPPSHRVNWAAIPDISPYDNTTRVMYFSKGGTCTYAYGLSYHGAQKLLKWLSMDVYGKAIDFGLHDMCSKPARNFTCLGVFPQVVGEHKSAGTASKDSDIGLGGTASRKQGFTFNIVHSTRLNADALMDGRLEDVVSQWPEDTPILTGPIETELRNEPTLNTWDPTDGEP